MPTLHEILDDKKGFPDDRKITLADGVETTLGDLRGGYMKERDYRQKTQELAREREKLTAETAKFAQDKEDAEAKLGEMLRQVVTPGAPKAQQVDEWKEYLERDPVAKHLATELAETKKQIAEIDKTFKEKSTLWESAIRQQSEAFMVDQHRRALAAIKSKDAELDEGELVKYAKDNAIPRLDLAYRLLTEDKRFKDVETKAKEAGHKDGYEKAKREFQQPMLPLRRVAPSVPKEQPQTFDEAAEAALRDPEILATMEGQFSP